MAITQHKARVGLHVAPFDSFWVLAREAIERRLQRHNFDLVLVETPDNPSLWDVARETQFLEDLLALELDILISWNLSVQLIRRVLGYDLPIVFLSEIHNEIIEHPKFVSPTGFYEIGQSAAHFLADTLKGKGNILCLGETGRRVDGFIDTVNTYTAISLIHHPCSWYQEQATHQIADIFAQIETLPDAIFAQSDPIALAACDVIDTLNQKNYFPFIIGTNGTPGALTAILNKRMLATVDIDPIMLGNDVIELVLHALNGHALPDHYNYQWRIVTSENIAEISVKKLETLSGLSTRLVGFNRQLEENQLRQLNTSIMINRRIGSYLDQNQLLQELTDLIHDNYNYDRVHLFKWYPDGKWLTLEYASPSSDIIGKSFTISELQILEHTIESNEAIFVPDMNISNRYPPDPLWPDIHSRVVLPIRLGDTIIGLLDLHSIRRQSLHLRHELIGLQLMADQLGIAIRNTELYAKAVQARQLAEQANQLKTRLLANVSHELRTPINVILGYSQSALKKPNPYSIDLPSLLTKDLEYIHSSGKHLIRLINDLLDLSRAEIGELSIYTEMIASGEFLSDVFSSFTASLGSNDSQKIDWILEIPEELPMMQADPARLRQIILNLLNNAHKFTSQGYIKLGAEARPPYLHIRVEDTGVGIPENLQSRIFDSFVTGEDPLHKHQGIGLGLSISRQLALLHGGYIAFESEQNQGSNFHLFLPLPTLSGRVPIVTKTQQRSLLAVISNRSELSKPLLTLANDNDFEIRFVRISDDLEWVLEHLHPALIVWDVKEHTLENWTIIQQLHNHHYWREIPFLLYDDAMKALNMEQSGIMGILPKPVSEHRLKDVFSFMLASQERVKILVVDDSKEARDLYTRLAKEAIPKTVVYQAENGAVALDILGQVIPDLVILDLMMPEIDGFELLAIIRSRQEMKHIPIVIMSGKKLTFEDVQRLDFEGVVFHSKDTLYNDEMIECLQREYFADDSLPLPTSRLVKYALAYMHQNYAEPLTRAQIAEQVGFSENYLTDLFQRELGITPWDCLTRFRIQQAAQLLANTHHSISFIAQEVGYSDPAYFSRVFKKYTRYSPRQYRNKPG